MKVFAVGASRNIGYYSSLNLLKQGHSVLYLLRRTNVFDNDANMTPFLDSKQARLVQGDALNAGDVQKAWDEASADGPVELVLFSVGGLPGFKLTKGFVVNPPDLCTACLLNTLAVIPRTTPQPRVVAITSNGITKASYRDLPLALKGMYTLLLESAHEDKMGMERLCQYSGGWDWSAEDKVRGHILPDGWESKIGGQEGWLKSLVVVRPALLSDGAEKGKYKVGEVVPGVYTISRRDVAHFIVNDLVPNWEKYEGKGLTIGY